MTQDLTAFFPAMARVQILNRRLARFDGSLSRRSWTLFANRTSQTSWIPASWKTMAASRSARISSPDERLTPSYTLTVIRGWGDPPVHPGNPVPVARPALSEYKLN